MSEQQKLSRKALVVLGMHRSGTSAMTRVLGLCGAALPADPHPAAFDNPEGFWEPSSVIALDEEILGAFDSAWDDIFAGRPRHYLSNFDRVFRQRAAEALDGAFSDADLIVLKDPRINVLAAFWDKALLEAGYEPTYVVMVRDPLEVAASLRMRNKLPQETALLLWLDNMCAAERDTRHARRVFVSYPDLLKSWRTCVDRIEAAAEVPLPRRTAAASNEIGRFLTTVLHHHHADEGARAELARTHPQVADAYAWFLEASRGREPPEAPSLAAAETYLTAMSAAMGPVVADLRTQLTEYRNHAGGLESVVASLQSEGEHAAAREALLRAENEAAAQERAELRQHADNLERERELARADLLRHAEALEHERAQLPAIREAIEAEARASAHAAFDADRSRFLAEAAEAERALMSARDAHALAERELQALRTAEQEVESARDEAELELASAREAHASTERELQAVRAAGQEAEDSLVYLRDRHDVLKTELIRLQLAMEAALSRGGAAERELHKLGAERDRSAAELHDLRRTGDERIRHANVRADEAEQARLELEAETIAQIEELTRQRDAILSSTSWRLTTLPRRLVSRLRGG